MLVSLLLILSKYKLLLTKKLNLVILVVEEKFFVSNFVLKNLKPLARSVKNFIKFFTTDLCNLYFSCEQNCINFYMMSLMCYIKLLYFYIKIYKIIFELV